MHLWEFLTLDQHGLEEFSFDMFHQNGVGGLNFADLYMMVELIHGRQTQNNTLNKKAIDVASVMVPRPGGGNYPLYMKDKIIVPKDRFLNRIHEFPLLLLPVLQIQVCASNRCGSLWMVVLYLMTCTLIACFVVHPSIDRRS